jgi:hypothetical protein
VFLFSEKSGYEECTDYVEMCVRLRSEPLAKANNKANNKDDDDDDDDDDDFW